MADATCSLCGNGRGLRVGRRPRAVICHGCVQDLSSAKVLPSTSVCMLCGKGEVRRRWFRRTSVPLFGHGSGPVVCGVCLSLCREILDWEAQVRRPRGP